MKFLPFVLLLSLTIISCGGDDTLPIPIDTLLDSFRDDACVQGELTTWDFKSEVVYCFDFGPCQPDKSIDIYQADGTLLCELMPGVNEICDGSLWADFAELTGTVYTKR